MNGIVFCHNDGSSHWDLFCKRDILECVFDWESELFWLVQPHLRKRDVLLKLKTCLQNYNFFEKYIVVFWISIERKNSEHPCKIRYSGKDYVFFRDTVVFLCCICLLLGKIKTIFIFYSLTLFYLGYLG